MRRPLVLQFLNQQPTSKDENLDSSESETKRQEWGELLHLPGKQFPDIDQIRQVIKEANLITARNENILLTPITLAIHSLILPTLTLVYLPDITKVPVGSQHTVIEAQLRDEVLKQMATPNTIFLAARNANTCLGNKEDRKLARGFDPARQRTIRVVKQANTRGNTGNTVDSQAGQTHSLHCECIAIFDREQRCIKNGDFRFSLEGEQKLESNDLTRDQNWCDGATDIATRLHEILIEHIKHTLPGVKNRINERLREHSAELKVLGENLIPNTRAEAVLAAILGFCNEYRTRLESGPRCLENSTPADTRLDFILHEHYRNAIEEIDHSKYITDVEIRSMLYCCSAGCSEEGLIGTPAFKLIARALAKKLEGPSIACVSLVHEELLHTMDKLLTKPIFQKFPEFEEKFRNILVAFFTKARDGTTTLVRDLVAMEACYIDTRHPDFINTDRTLAIVNERHCTPSGSGDTMKAEVEVVKLLVQSYHNITRRTLIDIVPKAITLKLIEYSKEEMQRELLENLYHSQQFTNLQEESERTTREHKECQWLVDCLTRASDIISVF
jgi:replication fork clamp-binding protein CrfC